MASTARTSTGTGDAHAEQRIWADRDYLLGVQYKTDANLAARQSIYAYQHPKTDLPREVIDVARPSPGEVIADIGCGNGAYLAELARRGFGGHVIGVDMSPGMLAAARERGAGDAALVNADATALPLRAARADVTLAVHMLYHVPEPLDAVRELRRITRPGGRVIIALNGEDHLREFRAAVTAAGGTDPGSDRLPLDSGEALLRTVFTSVTRRDIHGKLLAPPEAVAAYVHSAKRSGDPVSLAAGVLSVLFPADGDPCPITTHVGVLACS